MKKSLLLILPAFLLSISANAQGLPQCDSLVINCCTQDTANANIINLHASNSSSELFGYPGFILLDDNMDTVAIETVDYFGIGTFPQVHHLTLKTSYLLPFSGSLQLYSGFFDTWECSFPIYIPGTAVGLQPIEKEAVFNLFPNPANDLLNVSVSEDLLGKELLVIDLSGKKLIKINVLQPKFTISIGKIAPGFYLLKAGEIVKRLGKQ